MNKTVNATEAAQLLHKSEKTIRLWIKKGKFPNAREAHVNGLRQWAIPLKDVEALQPEEIPESNQYDPELVARIEELERRVKTLEEAITGITKPLPARKRRDVNESSDEPYFYRKMKEKEGKQE